MSVLGYDPALVERLALHLRATVDDLRQVRSTDQAADDALAAVRRAANEIELLWLPLTRQILTADPLRVHGDGTTLLDTAVLRLDVTGARRLGRMLDLVNLDELADDPAQLRVLAEELELVARDPARRAAFAGEFHEWARLADALARERMFRASDADAHARAALDAVFAGLADTMHGDLRHLDELQPYSAALVVTHLHLDTGALAEAADRLVLRWCDEPWSEVTIGSQGEWFDRSLPSPADVLFPLLAADPAAAQAYVTLAGAHPRTLFEATAQPALAHQVVLLATDPQHADTATAGRLLVPLFDWFRPGYRGIAGTAVYDHDWSLFLADAIAPWTLQLGPLNHDWGLTADHQRELLAVLVRDDATLARLAERADVVRRGVLASADLPTLEEFAAYLGMLQQLVVEGRVDQEEREARAWSLLLGAAGVAGTLVPGGTVVSVAENVALAGAGMAGPADVGAARHDAEGVKELTLTTAAASVAVALRDQWVVDGTLPAGFPAPPTADVGAAHPALQFRDEFREWLTRLPGGFDGPLADHADRLVSAFVDDAEAGASLVR